MRSVPRTAPLRVLHCPTATGGHPQQLARAERALGIESWSVAFESGVYGYAVDEALYDGSEGVVQREAKRWGLLLRAATKFDIVHFNYGHGIFAAPDDAAGSVHRRLAEQYHRALHMQDVRMLRALGKKIFVTYQGDDARQGDFCRAHHEITHAHEVGPDYYTPSTDRRKRQNIARFAAYADRIYALNPDLLDVLPAEAGFLPYASADLKEWLPSPKIAGSGRPLVIVHAPSNRAAKGTTHLEAAVRRLQGEEIDVELRLVEGVPRHVARAVYADADVVVDQLLAGWYGGFAVECMALGRPVIAYIRPADLRHVPAPMRASLPVINAFPGNIYDVLRAWLTTRRSELAARGAAGRAFVEQWHDPLKIAASVITDYHAAMRSGRSTAIR